MSQQCDVLVVGAGPAGASAAIEAARAGLSTILIDKARFPRDKCCGDGLTAGALRNLDQLGLDPATIPSWTPVTSVSLVSPDGRTRRFPLPGGDAGTFAVVCRRRELDAALVDLARQHGVTVLEDTPLQAISQPQTPQPQSEVIAEAGGRTFAARYLIAADGMWSPTRKLLGLAPAGYLGEWHAFRQYFTGVTGPAASELVVWFEPDLLPGYAWSFPLAGGAANVGFGIQRGRNLAVQDMKAVWPALLARPHVKAALGPGAEPEAPHRAWPIPARLGDTPLVAGRVLFVGDAATATDPMTGEGIGQAIETGRDAITAITTVSGVTPWSDDPQAVGAYYRQHLQRGMARDHSLARTLSRVLARRRTTELALATAGATAWTRRNFGRWMFEDYPRAAIFTPRRWRHGLFSSPGAFRGSSAL